METPTEVDPWARIFLQNVKDVLDIGGINRKCNLTTIDLPKTITDRLFWTQKIMERLEDIASPSEIHEILMRSSCHHPKSEIQAVIDFYQQSHDLDLIYRKLQEYFEEFLRWTLHLSEEIIHMVVTKGWGMAGVKQGTTIIATKMPANLSLYLATTDLIEKRFHYCHCPRVRDIIRHRSDSETLSSNYCYCGGGFYRAIWENILGHPVGIRLLKSVIQGDDVCQFLIDLDIHPIKK